ncbi:hypothetical protein CDL15_Pgr009343 [Punica granatum]|uniref:Uncharacterized protein n=1 Tax=Punica granatum TaxID=22663 RepID=A0A218XH88_PUNGR|nr:hypothetical protein CDL15_Pgr009343 [Punica granatum]PKI32365.1 hypothetical protein CRG98_047244 [Punica granatum]
MVRPNLRPPNPRGYDKGKHRAEEKYENLLHGSEQVPSIPQAGGGMPFLPGMNLGNPAGVCPPGTGGWPTNFQGFSTGSNANQAVPFPIPRMGSAACTNFPNFPPNMNPAFVAAMMNQIFRTKA